MRFIAFIEYKPEDRDKIGEKTQQIWEERKQSPDMFPKKLRLHDGSTVEYFMGGQAKGFVLYETDDPQQLRNLADYWMPEITFQFVPIFFAGET
jgi:hypothetical protein